MTSGEYELTGVLEEERAPRTCAYFEERLPYTNRVIHVRWSGESMWIPLGDTDTGLEFENHTSHPAPGQMLLYPGGYSETEFLLPAASRRTAPRRSTCRGSGRSSAAPDAATS